MMKDKIEMVKKINNKGEEVISLFLHCEEFGVLWLRDVDFSKGVNEYFSKGRSVSELHNYKYTCNKKLNKIIDRMPAYIKYAKEEALADREYYAAKDIRESEEYDTERVA